MILNNCQYYKLDSPIEDIAKMEVNANNYKLIDPVLKGPDWNPSDSGRY